MLVNPYRYIIQAEIDPALLTKFRDILEELGVDDLTGDENIEQLIEAVKRIVIGDTSVSVFAGDIDDNYYKNSYGTGTIGSDISLDNDSFSISEYNKIDYITISIVSDNPGAIEMSGNGWTINRSTVDNVETVIATYPLGNGTTKFDAYDAIDNLSISTNDFCTVTMSITGTNAGNTVTADEINMTFGNTWGTYADNNVTWEELSNTYMWGDLTTADLTDTINNRDS